MERELRVGSTLQFLENRDEHTVQITTTPKLKGNVEEDHHLNRGYGEFFGESVARYLNQIYREAGELSSGNQYVGSLVNPHTVEMVGDPEVRIDNQDGALSYGVRFDVVNDQNRFSVAMHGREEEFARRQLQREYKTYVQNENPDIREMLEEEFMEELTDE